MLMVAVVDFELGAMAVFAIISTNNPAAVLEMAERIYGDSFLKLTDDTALISSAGTAQDVSSRIGLTVTDGYVDNPIGSAVILSAASYYGLASPSIWDWIAQRWGTGR